MLEGVAIPADGTGVCVTDSSSTGMDTFCQSLPGSTTRAINVPIFMFVVLSGFCFNKLQLIKHILQ